MILSYDHNIMDLILVYFLKTNIKNYIRVTKM